MRHVALSFVALVASWCACVVPAAAGAQVHNYRGVVPVLVYHGVAQQPAAGDAYSISDAEFARHMAMLDRNGFHAISIEQYAAFVAGDVDGLPNRPILITFDDGRLDSFQSADAVLKRHDLRATIFAITANAVAAKPCYLNWAQLREMAAGGSWDVQFHAHAGHVRIPTGPRGRTGPYYANLLYRNGVREKFSAFKRRVTSDISLGLQLMENEIPSFEPVAFAVPFSDYGQQHTNYAPIPAWEIGWLRGAFQAVFVQDKRVFNAPGNAVGQRYGIRSWTTSVVLEDWLREALPRSAWVSTPKRPKLRRQRVGRRTVALTFRVRDGVTLRVKRRRAGRRSYVRVKVSPAGRVRDRRLRPGTRYFYRAQAVDAAGTRSATLTVRVRTRR